MLLDGLQIIGLALSATAHFRFSCHQQRYEFALLVRPAVVVHRFDQSELQFFQTDVVFRILIEIMQHQASQFSLAKFAPHTEVFTAPRNDYLKRGFDLAQIFVKRTAQPVHAGIVCRFK